MEVKVDNEVLFSGSEVITKIRELRSLIGNSQTKVNDDTSREVSAKVYEVIAECHSCLAILERIKRIRDAQSTSIPGGKRRKSRKST
jgi:hypothetical protein